MRRRRRGDGLIVPLASEDPQGAQRTLRLSAHGVALVRFGAVIVAVVALLVVALLVGRSVQLDRLQREPHDLEATLAERERALVREVQTVAGLEPEEEIVATPGPAPRAALGGPDSGRTLLLKGVDLVAPYGTAIAVPVEVGDALVIGETVGRLGSTGYGTRTPPPLRGVASRGRRRPHSLPSGVTGGGGEAGS